MDVEPARSDMSKVERPVIRNLIPDGATLDLEVAGAVRRGVEPETAPMASPQIALDPETAPIAKIVAYLRDHLGPEVTAVMSGVDSPPLVGQWVCGILEPEPLPSARLRFGYKTVLYIVDVYDGETARAWLFGTNEWLSTLDRNFGDVSQARGRWRGWPSMSALG